MIVLTVSQPAPRYRRFSKLKQNDVKVTVQPALEEDTSDEELPTKAIPIKASSFSEFAAKYELSRKFFHSMTGIFTIWLYVNGFSAFDMVPALIVMASLCFIQDQLRFRSQSFNEKFIKTYGFMMRDSEKDKYNGILFFLIGIIITSSLLPKDICVLCNLFLSWGDTSALFFGRLWGKYTWNVRENKSLAGCAAAFVTGVFSCVLFYKVLFPRYHDSVDGPNDIFYDIDTSKLTFPWFCFACGMVGTISELVSIYDWDDNFTIPVISGACLFSLVSFFK